MSGSGGERRFRQCRWSDVSHKIRKENIHASGIVGIREGSRQRDWGKRIKRAGAGIEGEDVVAEFGSPFGAWQLYNRYQRLQPMLPGMGRIASEVAQ